MSTLKLYDEATAYSSKFTTLMYSSSFSSAIKLLHKDLRQPIFDIYGFVRFADEIVDTFHDYDKVALLQQFKLDTYQALSQGISMNPILHRFQLTFNKYKIDTALLDAFLLSMEMDLSKQQYDDQTYNTYIYGSAEVVGTGGEAIAHEFAVARQKTQIPVAVVLGTSHFDKQILQVASGLIAPTLFAESAASDKAVPTVTRFATVGEINFGATKTA